MRPQFRVKNPVSNPAADRTYQTGEREMSLHKCFILTLGIGFASLITGVGEPALAQQPQDVIGKLGSNGIFIDGKTFDIARGTAKGDTAGLAAKLGAKEVGPSAIIFRSGDKVYMLEGRPDASPQAIKNFQDNWAVSYMKGMKDFQDNWAVSYVKNF
jgi:hypothetical protein